MSEDARVAALAILLGYHRTQYDALRESALHSNNVDLKHHRQEYLLALVELEKIAYPETTE